MNPSVTEESTYNGIPNPLFGIVSPQYLKGLEADDLKRMVKTLGKRMGLQFEPEAITYLHTRYGGHPLLTRIACSLHNAALAQAGRPVIVSRTDLLTGEVARDAELSFYCEHVVNELRQFYADEYAMLELLACKQVADFTHLTRDGMIVSHLREYGLLTDQHGVPKVAIPVVERHVANRGGGSHLVTPGERPGWLRQRIGNIIQDLRELERRVGANGRSPLFGPTSFPEADRLAGVKVVATHDEFDAFVNVLNRCLVESIEKYGAHIGNNNYFWQLKQTYPVLYEALERVKVYRHQSMHIKLKPEVEAKLSSYLHEDFDGRPPGDVPDLWFVLQQRVLDKLFVAIQRETAELN